jgi:large-conductance mechanosensitive channel
MATRKRKTEKATDQPITTGTVLRLEAPKSSRRQKQPVVKAVVEEVNPVGGFVEFLREYTVVTLAIGFVIAAQVQGLVKQLVSGFIDPLSKLFFGTALSARTFTLEFHGRSANFAWGSLASGFIDFFFVLIVIYVIIKVFQLDKLVKHK